MNDKKTAVMTIRIPQRTKEMIVAEAEKREWSPSKMAEKVLTTWAEKILETNQ